MFPPPFTVPPDLIRVDVPNHPLAIVSSDYGSTLEAIPTDVPWRYESIPQTDAFIGDVKPIETFDALNVSEWHADGVLGAGVKIAVFDAEWYGIDTPSPELEGIVSHDCFASKSCELPIDTLQLRYTFERGSHGVACAEIVRDIAPEAEIHVVRVNGQTTLENAVDWAIRNDIDFISMSLSFFGESFYDGTGPINRLMDKLAAANILMVTSAGNYADQHYMDSYADQNGNGLHEFEWGSEFIPIYFNQGSARISVNWDEYNNCGRSDFDVFLWSRDAELVGKATRTQSREEDGCNPSESLRGAIAESDWYFLQVHRAGGTGNTRFRIYARNGEFYTPMPEGSIVDPGNHPSVFTVGAVRADRYVFNDPEPFSSQGPTLDGLQKPNISGPDGLTTHAFGPIGFYGTSASTPAVTGALALLLSEDFSQSPSDAADRLSEAAIWEDHPNQDNRFGAGRARLPRRQSKSGCGGGAALILPFWLVAFRKFKFRSQSKK
ncbi:MAG: S8 family peptidase [Myxococcota bacterium]